MCDERVLPSLVNTSVQNTESSAAAALFCRWLSLKKSTKQFVYSVLSHLFVPNDSMHHLSPPNQPNFKVFRDANTLLNLLDFSCISMTWTFSVWVYKVRHELMSFCTGPESTTPPLPSLPKNDDLPHLGPSSSMKAGGSLPLSSSKVSQWVVLCFSRFLLVNNDRG